MNDLTRVTELLFKGEWRFFSDGILHRRKNLSFKARFNLFLQLWTKKLRLPVSLGIPYCLTVEPAAVCNLRCSTCPAGLKTEMCSPALLRFEDFKKTIDLLGDYLTHIQLWSWGEPFLNPHLVDMISYAKRKGIIIVTSTNAHFFDNEGSIVKLVHSGLDEIILAVDGTTQEVYEKYRQGGNLPQVLAGIKNLVSIKKREGCTNPRLHLRMVINPYNEHQKNEFAELARSIGVDVVSFKKIDTGMGGVPGDAGLLPDNKDYALKLAGNSYPFKCVSFWNFPVLSAGGGIGLCSLDSERQAYLGHIKDIDDMKVVWNSAKARDCRQTIKKNPDAFGFCRECACREPDFKNAYFDVEFIRKEV